ncbi:flippase [Candidatus Peregrinibacteria bacterium]|nr:flippase [Candidatus Peregrinibacteria bacterium]
MSTARKILSNTVSQIIGKFLVAILGLSVIKITTQYLGAKGYGDYNQVYEFLAFFGIAADLGLFTIAVREMSHREEDIPKIIGNILSLRTILVFITMALAVIAAFLNPKYGNTKVPLGVAIASISTFLTILNGTTTSVLQAKLKMHISSITTVIGKVVSIGAMLYIVFFGFPDDSETGFYMLLFAGVLGNFIMVIATDHYVRKITPLDFRFDFDFWKSVLVKSVPYGLALILNTIYFRIDSLFIYNIRGQEEAGIYGMAMKMLEQFSILPLYFMNSVLPVLTKAIREKNQKYRDIISYSFDFLAAMSVPMVVGGVILAFPIVFIFSTPEFLSRINEGFYGSDIAFQILIFALLCQFLNVLFSFILIAVNKQAKLLYVSGIAVAVKIVSNIIFVPEYGFRGAAVTSVITEFIILAGVFLFAKKYLSFSVNFKNFIKIIFSALVMGAAIYLLQPITYRFLQNWSVLLLIVIGMVIYGIMLFLTKTINRNLLGLLKKDIKEEIPIDKIQ